MLLRREPGHLGARERQPRRRAASVQPGQRPWALPEDEDGQRRNDNQRNRAEIDTPHPLSVSSNGAEASMPAPNGRRDPSALATSQAWTGTPSSVSAASIST